MWLLSFRKYARKTFNIQSYAQKQNFFLFLKQGFFIFFSRNFRVNKIFCIGFVFYSVSLQPDIEQNWQENIRENHNLFYILGWTWLNYLGQTQLSWVGPTSGLTNLTSFFFLSFLMLDWTQPNHLGQAKMGPAQHNLVTSITQFQAQ